MTYHFSHITDEQIGMLIAAVEAVSYISRRDGCSVVMARCCKCARGFEEELEAAKAKIVNRDAPLCLDCDTDAEEPGFMGLTIHLGWFMV